MWQTAAIKKPAKMMKQEQAITLFFGIIAAIKVTTVHVAM